VIACGGTPDFDTADEGAGESLTDLAQLDVGPKDEWSDDGDVATEVQDQATSDVASQETGTDANSLERAPWLWMELGQFQHGFGAADHFLTLRIDAGIPLLTRTDNGVRSYFPIQEEQWQGIDSDLSSAEMREFLSDTTACPGIVTDFGATIVVAFTDEQFGPKDVSSCAVMGSVDEGPLSGLLRALYCVQFMCAVTE
jgi:hypothetical protein